MKLFMKSFGFVSVAWWAILIGVVSNLNVMKWHESQIYMFIMLIVISRGAFVILENGKNIVSLKEKLASILWLLLFNTCNFK